MTKKIKPKLTKAQLIDLLVVPPLHIGFPYTLHHKDGKDKKSCYFSCVEHMKKYIQKNKLKKVDCKVEQTKPRIRDIHDED